MEQLSEPREILDLPDMGVLSTHVLSWEEGETTIFPDSAPQGKVVVAMRIHVPQGDKAHFPFYWDITSKTLRAQLLPMLNEIVAAKRTVKITKYGIGPAARFRTEVI